MSKKSIQKVRYQEIDAARGIAVLGMVGFHTAFIAQFFFGIILFSGPFFWRAVPILIGGSFLTLAGLSLHIGASKGKYPSLLAAAKRSGFLFSLGLLITLGTYLLDFGGRIYFGVLHCIALGSFISFCLLRLPRYLTLIIGMIIISVGMYWKLILQPCWGASLFWLYPCFCPALGPMFDYYPLIPWMGFMCIGLFLGKQYYPQGIRGFSQAFTLPSMAFFRGLTFIGRHSLLIYFIHQPIIYAILYLTNQR